jgi:ribosomal protein S17E
LTLLQRRRDDEEDTQMLKTYYEELNSRYEKVIRILARYMPILTLDTSKLSQNDIAKSATKFVFDELER